LTCPILLEEVGSTNAWALARAAALPDGQWVRALRQTAGRGRQGRGWASHPSNLAASCVVKPRPGEGAPHEVGFALGIALFEAAAEHVARARLMLKWPNDLLLDGAKLAGILLEREGDIVVAGVGVNLAVAPVVPGRCTAALGDAMAAPPPPPEAFLDILAGQLAAWRALRCKKGFRAIRAAWLERAHPSGTWLETHLGDRPVCGRFAALGEDGALHLLDGTGERLVIHAGDVQMASSPAR
jgi:BirA family biotin operon repressor/biotin-[acetyl-CoA-carboxylase] ligase